jgi:catechol 2,3-dioxygenase-like lactoylglutathione lyase family enzyme
MRALRACSHALLAAALSGLAAAGAIAADAAPVNPLGLKAHHITAAVSDMDRAVRWYREVLGFAVTEQGSRGNSGMKFAELAIPGFGVALIQLPPGVGKPRGDGELVPTWMHIVFTVPDVPAAYKLLKSRGTDAHTRDNSAATTYFLLHDSEGNEIEIAAP